MLIILIFKINKQYKVIMHLIYIKEIGKRKKDKRKFLFYKTYKIKIYLIKFFLILLFYRT